MRHVAHETAVWHARLKRIRIYETEKLTATCNAPSASPAMARTQRVLRLETRWEQRDEMAAWPATRVSEVDVVAVQGRMMQPAEARSIAACEERGKM